MKEKVIDPRIKIAGAEIEYGLIFFSEKESRFISPRRNGPLFYNLLREFFDELKRYLSQITGNPSLWNAFYKNGARIYQDRDHLEYATPECRSAEELLLYEEVGDRLVAEFLSRANERILEKHQGVLLLVKNNSDFWGNTYAYHENYLCSYGEVSWNYFERKLLPFLIARQALCGAGKINDQAQIQKGASPYLISQRSLSRTEIAGELELVSNEDHFFRSKRPIIDFRDDKPLADPEKYFRLHLACGDSNRSQLSTFLKIGTTLIVLEMIQAEFLDIDFYPQDPLAALYEIAEDPDLKTSILLENGKRVGAINILEEYLNCAKNYFKTRREPRGEDLKVLEGWERVIAFLRTNPEKLSCSLDWLIKRRLFLERMAQENLNWEDSGLKILELKYHFLGYSSLFEKLKEQQKVEDLLKEESIEKAMEEPPKTRAHWRAKGEDLLTAEQIPHPLDWIDWGRITVGPIREEYFKFIKEDPEDASLQDIQNFLSRIKI